MANLAQMKQQHTAPAVAAANHPILSKTTYLDKRKDLLGAGIPGHMTVEREIRSATVMLMQSKDLQEASAESFYMAVSVAVNSGIGLGNGKGYLVAYKGKVSYVPGWKGLVDLVSRSGRGTVWTGVVHKGDYFEYELGDSPALKHRPGDNESHKDITHYYAVGRVKGSEWPIIAVWSVAKVIKHLNDFNKVGSRHYALKDDNNMEMYARKVVLLQVLKYMPQSQDLENAIAAEEAHETNRGMTIEGNMVFVNDYDDTATPPGDNAAQPQGNQPPGAPQDPDSPGQQQGSMRTEMQDNRLWNQDQQHGTTQQKNGGDNLSMGDKLKNRLRILTDIDMLDAEADLINDVDAMPQEKDELREIYRARRAELLEGQQAQQQTPQRRPAARTARTQMNLE